MSDTLTVTTSDGRTLAYAEYGAADGPALFMFHGTPGSRLDHDPFDRPSTARIVTIDRPGYGRSSPQPGRRLIDWPTDVLTVADALGIDRFSVMGISGGGPYAVACAALIPDRIHRVGVVCGVGPLGEAWTDDGTSAQNVETVKVARHSPSDLPVVGEMFAAAVAAAPDAESFFAAALADAPAVDAAVMAIPEVQAMMFTTLRESMHQGGGGFADEYRVLVEPWGLDLGAIRVEVRILQGTDDINVPPSHASWLASQIPGSTLTMMSGEGHMSLAIHHAQPFGEALIA